MPKQTNLLKRGSTYYFRAKVPVDLQPYLGKEAKHSLKTKDRTIAVKRVRQAAAEFDRRCEAVRQDIRKRERPGEAETITDELIQHVCDLWRHMSLAGDEENRIDGYLSDPDHQAEREQTDVALKHTLATTDLDAIEPGLHQFLWLNGIRINPQSEGYRKLLYRFLQTVKNTHGEQLQRDAGEVVQTPEQPAKPEEISQTTKPGEGLSLQEAFEDWKRYAPNRPDKTVQDMTRVVREFSEHSGGKPLEQTTRADVVAYRNALTGQGRRSKTVSKRIALLCALFNTVIDNGKFEKVNPAQRIKEPTDDSLPREPFERDELQRIFSAPAFLGEREFKRKMGETGYWMPILGLYQGCRREELGQMTVGDVKSIDGIDCLVVTDLDDEGNLQADGSKQLKNKSSRRQLPLHPQVVDLGFLDYVERIRQQGHTHLFPNLKQRKDGKRTDDFGRAFSEFIRKDLGIKNTSRVFHSFRNNFRDACREAGIDEEVSDALMGHSGEGKTGRTYGKGFSVQRLNKAMRLIDYPGLVIPRRAG